jgi:F-type H+-transporting ATPase subunit gamma
VLYTQFFSVGRYYPTVERFIPIPPFEKGAPQEFIFEPGLREVVDALMKHYLELEIWRILLESSTAEHAARMIAMDQATRNAQDMVRELTLQMNKLRQEKITKELLDIVTAIEAMKKSQI